MARARRDGEADARASASRVPGGPRTTRRRPGAGRNGTRGRALTDLAPSRPAVGRRPTAAPTPSRAASTLRPHWPPPPGMPLGRAPSSPRPARGPRGRRRGRSQRSKRTSSEQVIHTRAIRSPARSAPPSGNPARPAIGTRASRGSATSRCSQCGRNHATACRISTSAHPWYGFCPGTTGCISPETTMMRGEACPIPPT
jgi:hypothetical protein